MDTFEEHFQSLLSQETIFAGENNDYVLQHPWLHRKSCPQIQQLLGTETTIVDLKNKKQTDVNEFGRLIIGGSIHAGQIQEKVKDFCEKNMENLLKKELGLFTCCMEEGEKAEAELWNVFSKKLREHAKATACLGGEFNFEKMIVK